MTKLASKNTHPLASGSGSVHDGAQLDWPVVVTEPPINSAKN